MQLSTILVGIFGLFLFIGGGWLYHDLQYRYVVDSRYNTIFDKAYSVYLINKGISMDIINDKIYAMNDDVYVIINQESNTIIVYYLNLEDVVEYCKNKISDKNCKISREGKNWICITDDIKILVNACSYMIVSAKKR